jgi:large repetitive protein
MQGRDGGGTPSLALPLEPRFMFDAAGVATAADAAVAPDHQVPAEAADPAIDHALVEALAQLADAAPVPLAPAAADAGTGAKLAGGGMGMSSFTASIPSAPDLLAGSDTGGSDIDDVTADATPTFTGSGADAGAVVRLYANGVEVGSATADASGDWTITTSALVEDTYIFTAGVDDQDGNPGPVSDGLSVTIDTTAPAASAAPDLAAASDTGSSGTDNLTSDTTPTFTGITGANRLVRLYADGVEVGSTTSNGSGAWSITSPTLAAGTYGFTARTEDAAGNLSPASAVLPVVIDTTAPAAPSAPDLAAGSDTGASGTDDITADATPTFTGSGAEANAVVRLYADGTLVGSAMADASGNWTVTASALAAGTYSFTARVADRAGNLGSASAVLPITIDTAGPAVSMPDMIANSDTGPSDTDNLTGSVMPTFTGTTEPGAIVQLFIDNAGNGDPLDPANVILGSAFADASGSWSVMPAAPIADGTWVVKARGRDTAGNFGPASAGLTITIDTTPPAAPSAPDLVAASDTGRFSTDNLTSDTTPTFTGSGGEANAIVGLYADGMPVGVAMVDGSGNWTITSSALAEGTYSFIARVVDAAGNPGPISSGLTVTIDTTGLAVSAPDMTAGTDTGSSSTDDITADATPTFTGTTEPGAIVQLFIDNAGNGDPLDPANVTLGSAFADASGNWSITPVWPLADGAWVVKAWGRDTAGNFSPTSAGLTVTIDATPPLAPSVPDLAAASDTGSTDTDNLTSDATPTFTGTGPADMVVRLYAEGMPIGSATADGAGNWSITSSTLVNGTYTVTARTVDAAGNESADSAGLSVTIDRMAPVIDTNGALEGTTLTATFVESSMPARIAIPGATLTDDNDITGMTLVLDATPDGGMETIVFRPAIVGGASLASLGLTGSYDSATRTYTVSGTASASVYQRVLRGMGYYNTSEAPDTTARTVTISVTDAEGTTGQGTSIINITPTNDVPVATNLVQSKAVVEGGSAVAFDDIVVTDPDGTDTITATLTLSDPAAGTLSTGTFGSATATYNAATGVWTVTGSVTDVNAALAAVQLTPSADNDQNFTIATRIRDAAHTGPADGLILVAVTGVDGPPLATNLTQSKAVVEGGGPVDLDDIIVIDPDGTDTITATLTLSDPAAGTLSTGTFGSASSSFDAATGVWAVTGLFSDVNAALAAVQLAPSADNDQDFTITARIRDAAGTGPADGTITFDVTPVNDAPVALVPPSISITEDTPGALTGITFFDIDAGSSQVWLIFRVTAGALSATGGSGVAVGGGGASLALIGSVADINAFIAASRVTYTPAAGDTGTQVLTVEVNDGGNSGTGGSGSDTKTVALNISAVNDAPVITLPSGQAKFVVGDIETQVSIGAGLADVDSSQISGAMMVLADAPDGTSEGIWLTESGRTIATQNGLSWSYDPSNRTLTVSGIASREVYEQVLQLVLYRNADTTPDKTTRTLSFTVTDAEGATSVTATREVWLTERPFVVENDGAATPVEVTKGDRLVINGTMLAAADAETQDPSKLTYVIQTMPAKGKLYLQVGDTYVQIGPNGTVTQADLNLGRVSYLGETTGADGFTFLVRDEHFDPSRETGTFNITVKAQPGIIPAAAESSSFSEEPAERVEIATREQMVEDPVNPMVNGTTADTGFRLPDGPIAASRPDAQAKEMPAGKPSLSAQLRASGQAGMLADAAALLESLAGSGRAA